jgi:hypothetical protein
MGNSNGEEQAEGRATFMHPELGRLVQVKEEDPTLEMRVTLASKQEYSGWADLLPRLSSENEVVLIPLRHEYQETGFCGFTGSAVLEFEYFPFQLDLEINQRMSREHRFNEYEVWYVLFTLLEAVVDVEQTPAKVMDIRPRNVVLSPEGQVKLITKLTYPGFQNAMIKVFSKKDSCFLSPEEMKALQEGNIAPKLLFPTAELFAVGMTIFEACALRRCDGVYDLDNLRIDRKTLDSYLRDLAIEGLYSKFLIRTIELMLE